MRKREFLFDADDDEPESWFLASCWLGRAPQFSRFRLKRTRRRR